MYFQICSCVIDDWHSEKSSLPLPLSTYLKYTHTSISPDSTLVQTSIISCLGHCNVFLTNLPASTVASKHNLCFISKGHNDIYFNILYPSTSLFSHLMISYHTKIQTMLCFKSPVWSGPCLPPSSALPWELPLLLTVFLRHMQFSTAESLFQLFFLLEILPSARHKGNIFLSFRSDVKVVSSERPFLLTIEANGAT